MEEELEIVSNPSHSSNKLGDQLLADPDFSDVTLVCRDGQQIPAHRAVLSGCSLFLRQLLYGSVQQSTFLYLGSVGYRDVVTLLNFIYLGNCTLSKKNKVSVTSLAGALQVQGWPKEVCDVTLADEEEDLHPLGTEDIKENATKKEIHIVGDFQVVKANWSNLPLVDKQEETNNPKKENIATKPLYANENAEDKVFQTLGEFQDKMENLQNLNPKNYGIRPTSPTADGEASLHQCCQCDESFSQPKNLARHQVEQHDTSGEIVFFCGATNCKFSTVREETAIKHRASQIACPVSRCQLCGDLVKSQKTHFSNQRCARRYPCPQCQEAFSKLSEKKVHLLTHD